MASLRIKISIAWILALLIVPFFAFAQTVSLAAPELMLTWQAENFAPAEFRGKIFPVKGSRITVALNLIEDNRIADISRTEVRWFVDNNLVSAGTGAQLFEYRIPQGATDEIRLRAQLPNHRGAIIEKEIIIPIASPEVILQSKHPNNETPRGEITLKAIPYFFNTQQLAHISLQWLVNNQPPEIGEEIEALDEINITVPEGTPAGSRIDIRVIAKNIMQETEFAIRSLLLTILP